jgi:hypothetical protein
MKLSRSLKPKINQNELLIRTVAPEKKILFAGAFASYLEVL